MDPLSGHEGFNSQPQEEALWLCPVCPKAARAVDDVFTHSLQPERLTR